MTITVYNTLSRTKEVFTPREPGRVHMYVCGPTVYDHAHLGHAKTYVNFDMIVRYLRYSGYKVRYVQNITDVGHILDTGEDRILKGAARERIEPMEVVERYARSYFEDMGALGVLPPDISPRASAHVPEQIEMIKVLLAKGHAYEVNGSVYFDVRSYPDYGKLSGRRLEEPEAGSEAEESARAASRLAARDEKRNPEDFALWKLADPAHILRWPSPWGWGFPGWHIECSAMSLKYLGNGFDIHGGGIDNIFPHNECEIAQAEAATDEQFARYWLLGGSLTVDGVKMSKSLGNFTTIKDLLKKYKPEALRFFILSGHYRNPIDFSDAALEAASKGWERLAAPALAVRERLRLGQGKAAPTPGGGDAAAADLAAETKRRMVEALDDDFNAPVAVAALFDYAREVNKLLSADVPPGKAGLEALEAVYRELGGEVLGIIPAQAAGGAANAERESGLIRLLIELRGQARARKDFAQADAIRDQAKALGVVLEDGKEGTSWKLV